MVPDNYKSGSSVGGWFWLMVPCEVAVSPEGLSGAGGSASKLTHVALSQNFAPHHRVLSREPLATHPLAFSRLNDLRERKCQNGSHSVFFNLILASDISLFFY
jgi:hypothetical protein